MMISLSRLLVLGMLARGQMHGHQIRREAELRDVEQWAGIRPGALYGALHRLEEEGLIQPSHTEQAGRFPARTVYSITAEGRKELGILLEAALQQADFALGPFDVALLVADALPADERRKLIARRMARLSAQLESLVADRQQLKAQGRLGAVEEALMRHAEVHLESELRWHEEVQPLIEQLDQLPQQKE
ncbi:PadR family transcriptional regulator [Ktedonosporobacter rubrisoli]|uniref:PadR family transcriptional regulator n=1 Tax=Ktedonosporobacter rubrisoli TaxID=2509675 RepID=A0A4V0Z0G5_KTERU|nr:PadR family transcriptional regulator [Ktedonosporobacter rubrisoli]QBD83141.1 PadR family transcriptional regulator [Ktedonosporobacter rubrisoli]